MSKSSVNVLIVTYNQETLIKDTLDSILNQSYDNISKIVVADDGSTDETPNIIKQYALDNPVIEPILGKKNKEQYGLSPCYCFYSFSYVLL